MFLALAGGVGRTNLAQGLAAQLQADELLVAVNTDDDSVYLEALRMRPPVTKTLTQSTDDRPAPAGRVLACAKDLVSANG